MTPTEQKQLLDAIARELYGWPDDGTRRTYAPDELPAMARRLRAEAQALADVRTLDEWADLRGRKYEQWRHDPLSYVELRDMVGSVETIVCLETGETPAAARHAAAEWVRGQR